MKFRPCIDIHEGKVKQIVGGSLSDDPSKGAMENYVSSTSSADFALMYKERGLFGGHVIVLDKKGSDTHESSVQASLSALSAFPGGLQAGGGIDDTNAHIYLDAGASHVIVTSYVFYEGRIDMERLSRMRDAVGRKRLVLDLSVRLYEGEYRVATNRWQKVTDEVLDVDLLEHLADYCDEYLIHAADVEGRMQGVDKQLLGILGEYDGNPVTYAGGIGSMQDIIKIKDLGKDRLDFTVGSALDIFGGRLEFKKVCDVCTE